MNKNMNYIDADYQLLEFPIGPHWVGPHFVGP